MVHPDNREIRIIEVGLYYLLESFLSFSVGSSDASGALEFRPVFAQFIAILFSNRVLR